MELLSFPPTPPVSGSARALLLRLAAGAERTGTARWEHAIDDVALRLHELAEPERFEDLCAGWLERCDELVEAACEQRLDDEGVRDLNLIVSSAACVLEHLSGRGSLEPQELRLAYRTVDAARLTRELSVPFRTLASRRGIHFTVDLPDQAMVEADGDKLQLIVLTLLYNAFKHTPMRGAIRVALRGGGPDDTVVLSVADGSPRIGAAESEGLFAPGVHDRSVTYALSGRNVGLATARDCARLHGGWLVLRASEKRRGCLLEAALPARAPRGIAVAREPSAPPEGDVAYAAVEQLSGELSPEALHVDESARGDRPLALIVEDNPHTQRILVLTLQPAYAVATAADGAEGLAKAIALKPDVILTDVRMPHMDGETMVHELRAHEELAEVPILVLTASEDRAVIVRLLEAGVEDVLRKPFEISEVRARVRALVAAKRARDTLNATIGHQEDNLDLLAEEVASHQRGLQSALAQLSEERDRARRADRSKGNFLRMMSHELKTPLAALQLQLHALERKHGRTDGVGEDVTRMRRSIRRLTLLIETMTEWVRVADGRFLAQATPAALVELVQAALDAPGVSAGAQRIRLVASDPPPPPLVTDARLVTLVLDNLLSFALQLCESGTVEVEVAAGGAAQLVRLRCCATRAVDELDTDHLFQAFSDEGDIGARPGAGSGLGLRVVRDIARAIGGELELVPSADRSCPVFVLTLRSLPGAERRPSELSTVGGPHVDRIASRGAARSAQATHSRGR